MPATFAIIGWKSDKAEFIASPDVGYKAQVLMWNEIRMGKPMDYDKVEKWSSDQGKLAEFHVKNKPARKPSKKIESND
jgi:hypothetical protein